MLTKKDEFVISRNGMIAGPYTLGQFEEMLRFGTVMRTDLIWRQGMTEWRPLGELLAVNDQKISTALASSQQPPGQDEEPVAQVLLKMAGGCLLWLLLLGLAIGGGIIFPLLLILLPLAVIGGLIDTVQKLIKISKRRTRNQNLQK